MNRALYILQCFVALVDVLLYCFALAVEYVLATLGISEHPVLFLSVWSMTLRIFERLQLDRKFQVLVDEFLPLLLRQLSYRVASYLMSMVMMVVLNSMVMLVFVLDICCTISIRLHSTDGCIKRVLIMHCGRHHACVLRYCCTSILSIVVVHTLGLYTGGLRMLHFNVIVAAVIVSGVVVLLVTH